VRAGELNTFWRVVLPPALGLLRLCFRARIHGTEHIPATGPAIIAFNHVSFLDGPVLAILVAHTLRRETRFLVAAEMFRKPVIGWILRSADQIPIRRGEGDGAALDEVIDTIRHGGMTAIAPEGRVHDRGGDDGMQRLRTGVARIALPTGAPVLPVGIWGTQTRWPRGGPKLRLPVRPRLVIDVGPPLLPSGDLGDQADIDAFVERLRPHLEAQVEAARRATGDTG
jgi:putative phosphoserine phosphatase/1-acylglycerol-3-phosphate O-acyltransferase